MKKEKAQKKKERNLSIPYSESSITLIPKAEWLYQQRKVTKNLTYEYQCKNLKGNIRKLKSTEHFKNNCIMTKCWG